MKSLRLNTDELQPVAVNMLNNLTYVAAVNKNYPMQRRRAVFVINQREKYISVDDADSEGVPMFVNPTSLVITKDGTMFIEDRMSY